MSALEESHDGPGYAGTPNDESLARRAAARDEAAWAEIFEAHFRAVYAFIRSRVPEPATAEDLAASVFEVAFSRADSFVYHGVPIEAWLIGIARNLLRDHVKRAIRRGPHDSLDDAVTPPEPDATALVDMRQDLTAAMTALTEDQQTVIALRFLLDRSVADTAVLMERSEDAVKNLQRRALAALHRALDGRGYEHAGGGGGG